MVEGELMNTTGLGPLIGIIMAFFVVFMIIAIALYIYQALTLMAIAKRTNTENGWLAWIPIGNLILMAKIAKMHWWPVLLLILIFIPIVNIFAVIAIVVFFLIWLWKICEARGKPGWWAIITIIPFIGGVWALIMYGILAWGE